MSINNNAPEEISFGEWLRQRRRMLDLTQQALADQVGCARITLRRIESGARKPSKELAQILLSKLGVPEIEHLQWILFARGASGFPATPSISVTSKSSTNLPAPLTSFIGREGIGRDSQINQRRSPCHIDRFRRRWQNAFIFEDRRTSPRKSY